MKRWLLAGFAAWALAGASRAEQTEITVVNRPDPGPVGGYPANRPPLQPSLLVKLPAGSVKAEGWLRKMLALQAAGFHGQLGEISPFLKKQNNAWLSPTGKGDHGWEEVPYWLKGYIGCAYLLDDASMREEAKVWIEAALKSQQPDGWFGPDKGRKGVATDLVGRADLWPNMIMLFCLQIHHERTQDPRVLDLMTRYFKHLATLPEKGFLTRWAAARGGDQLYSILWLYNRTGDEFLLDLARKTHRATLPWNRGVADWHNVNMAQGFREPAQYWQLSGDPAHYTATRQVWQQIRLMYGQVPGGMFGADENAREGHYGPRQAIETCGVAEKMLSDGLLLAVTGEPVWADRCEDAAFNTMPATMTADLKALRYLTAPNQPQSDHVGKSPGLQNSGPMYCLDPHDHRCCQHNAGHAWPYFIQHMWFASSGNGLAALMYGPCVVSARTTGEREVRIVESTQYPFDDEVTFTFSGDGVGRFPLYLRIPDWCTNATIAINGEAQPARPAPGRFARILRTWQDGDRVVLALPQQIRLRTWTENRGAVSVDRGPLTYSLRIAEAPRQHGGTPQWPAWDLFPASPWNYGLVLTGDTAKDFEFKSEMWPDDEVPFRGDTTPFRIRARAKRIPGWTLDGTGLVRELIDSPLRSAEPEETVTLIPMGAARLRIAAFPVIGAGDGARDWPPPPP